MMETNRRGEGVEHIDKEKTHIKEKQGDTKNERGGEKVKSSCVRT